MNDGAAAVLVMSEERARELGLTPRARIVASAVAGLRPEIMGLGPIPAIRAALKTAGLTIEDIDLVEMNEAFAAQVVPCRDELGIDPEKLDVNGGAIALGHPFGMTGARIMSTLLNNLDSVDGRFGIESMCVAGGMGQAMIVERLNGSHWLTKKDGTTMATTGTQTQGAARDRDLTGRVALVTGGTRGIGAAICRALAADGAVVAAGYSSNQARADELRQSVEADKGTLSLHQGNIGDAEDCVRVVKDVIDQHGRLDILMTTQASPSTRHS